MENIKVKKEELVTILRDNRAKHRSEFEKALKNYRTSVIGILEDKLKDARDNKRVKHRIELEQPMDQTKDYDRALKMLEMSVDGVVELSEVNFAQYVQDDWSWKQQFSHLNSSFADTAMTYGAIK